DTGTYVIGTWDGRMHVCSFSNSEHFLDTYNTLSVGLCSANWTIQLWKLDSLTPKMRFTSVHSPVDSVKWSPNCSTVFAAVYRHRVEVWDLSSSTAAYPAFPLRSDSPSLLREANGSSRKATEMSSSSTFNDDKGGSSSVGEPEYGHDPASGGIFSSDYKRYVASA
ncbi:hypothetical protein GOODEAATRI_017088, partial [Goodea atripinnis]